MAQRITNGMASAMAVASEQNMAHSTPLHSCSSGAVVCGVFGCSIHPSLQAVEGQRPDAWMGRFAATVGGQR